MTIILLRTRSNQEQVERMNPPDSSQRQNHGMNTQQEPVAKQHDPLECPTMGDRGRFAEDPAYVVRQRIRGRGGGKQKTKTKNRVVVSLWRRANYTEVSLSVNQNLLHNREKQKTPKMLLDKIKAKLLSKYNRSPKFKEL